MSHVCPVISSMECRHCAVRLPSILLQQKCLGNRCFLLLRSPIVPTCSNCAPVIFDVHVPNVHHLWPLCTAWRSPQLGIECSQTTWDIPKPGAFLLNKSMSLFYNKVCELVSLLGDLVDIQTLTDTDILQVGFYF